MLANSSKDIQHNKEAENSKVETHFPSFLSFIDSTEQQIPRPKNKQRRKICYSGKRMHTVKTQIMVNNRSGLIIHKTDHEKGRRHMIIIFIKKIDLLLQKRF